MFSIVNHFPIYAAFLLLLIISGAFTADLLPCKLRKLLQNNLYLKHFIAFMTLMFFIVMSIPTDHAEFYVIISQTILLYVFFLGLIKISVPFLMVILCIIALTYILVIRKTDLKTKIDKLNDQNDIADASSNKMNTSPRRNNVYSIMQNNEVESKKPVDNNTSTSTSTSSSSAVTKKQLTFEHDSIVFINDALMIGIIPIYIVGFYLYLTKKMHQYKNKFSFATFIFGKIKCEK